MKMKYQLYEHFYFTTIKLVHLHRLVIHYRNREYRQSEITDVQQQSKQ